MKKVFHIETTTGGKTLLYCSVGDKTNDVEIIEMPQPMKKNECDCEYELCLKDGSFCKKCENRFYDKVFTFPRVG